MLGDDIEPFEVIRSVEEHRLYWKPEMVRVVLLAESQVYTTAGDLSSRIGDLSKGLQKNDKTFKIGLDILHPVQLFTTENFDFIGGRHELACIESTLASTGSPGSTSATF
jgi:hypothetical protein